MLVTSFFILSIFHNDFKEIRSYDREKSGLRGRVFNTFLTDEAQEAFVDSVDQDQTPQNVQSDLWSTQSTLLF